MPTSWIVEPDDVFEDCHFCGPPRWPGMPPYQLGLDRLEEGFDSRVVVAVAGAAH